jgi:hypothetical protein
MIFVILDFIIIIIIIIIIIRTFMLVGFYFLF